MKNLYENWKHPIDNRRAVVFIQKIQSDPGKLI